MAEQPDSGAGIMLRSVEIAVAALFIIVSAVVIYDSIQVGARWADDGPQAGYFPFYIGLIMAAASAVNLLRAVFIPVTAQTSFSSGPALRQVLAVLLPAALFVGGLYWLGLYVAAALFIAVFMLWQGAAKVLPTLLVSVGVPLALFFLFEKWFLVPLPKGPLEAWLGY